MLKIIGFIIGALVAAFLLYVLGLTLIYIVQGIIKAVKGGRKDGK